MKSLATLVLMAVLLAGCGAAPAAEEPTPVPMPIPTEAPVEATFVSEPTLTADEQAIFQSMATRAESMVKAVHDLQALGQEVRATALWKGKVQAAALIITGGRMVIQQAALPAHYGPLKTRAKDTTEQCAVTVEGLPRPDALTIASVAALDPQLKICERDLKRLQLSFSEP